MLSELVRLVNDGTVRIPRFQRGLRWELADVRKLFESVLWGYPIGSLLMWERPAPARTVSLGARLIHAPALDRALFVVDGQQRLTSFANALSDEGYQDDRFALDYDLETGRFLPARRDRSETAVPLPVLFDLRRLLSWYTTHPEVADWVTEANDVATRLRQYSVPVSVVSGVDEEVLRDIFDRMNNYGKRLSRAEVFTALNPAGDDDSGDELTVRRIAERVDADLQFGVTDDDTVLRVILSRRGPDVTREIRGEFAESGSDFPHEGRSEAFGRAEDAVRLAVAFLQGSVGIPHLSLLPHRYLLVVLARFFGHFPDPAPRNLILLRRWFWRAAVLGPEIFKGSAKGAMRALNNRIVPGDESGSVQGLLTAASRAPFAWPNVRRFRTNEASTRIVLAATEPPHPGACHRPSRRAVGSGPRVAGGGPLGGERAGGPALRRVRRRAQRPDRDPRTRLSAADGRVADRGHTSAGRPRPRSRRRRVRGPGGRGRAVTAAEHRFGVWLYDRKVGVLVQRGDHTRFVFDPEYWLDPDRAVLGLRFEEHPGEGLSSALRLPPWFSNLLPESEVLRGWIARDRGANP